MKIGYSSFAARLLQLGFCVIALVLAAPLAFAEEAIQPKPRDLATLLAEFPQLDAARSATKPNTRERADAAQKAAQLASDIGWLHFEKGESTQAAEWFARRMALKKESYDHARQYWEQYLNLEAAQREKQFAARIKEWEESRDKETDPKKKEDLQQGIGALVQMQYIERYAAISQLQTLARSNDDASSLARYSEQELAIKRIELADLQKLKAAPRAIAVKQSEVAKALERVANAQSDLALFAEAENNFQEALQIRRALPEDLPERQLHETLSAMGAMYLHDVGDYRKAREYYTQALQRFEAAAPLRAKALEAEKTAENKDLSQALAVIAELTIVANLGAVLQEAGEYSGAQTYFDRAMQVAEALPDGGAMNIFTWAKAVMRARALSELASLHVAIGENEKAGVELDEVIRIKRALGDDESTANALQQLAYLHYARGDRSAARRFIYQARMIFQQAQRLQSVVTATSFLATIAREENRIDEAAKYAEEALPLARQSGNVSLAAGALRTLATVRLDQKRLDEASTLLDEAAKIDERTASTVDKIATLGRQGQVLEAQEKNDAALEKYKSAVALLEQIRTTGGGAKFGENQSTAKHYERLVLLLIKTGRGEEAFDWMQRARSKQLQESLRLTSLKTGDKNLQAMIDRAKALETKLATAREQEHTERGKPSTEQDAAKLNNLQRLIASTQEEYKSVLDDIATRYPKTKVFTADPLQIRKVQRSIPRDSAIIQYAALEEEGQTSQFIICVVTRDALKIFSPQISTDDLWKRIRVVRRQLGRPAANPLPTRGVSLAPGQNEDAPLADNLAELYEMLITPIEDVVRDKSTLVFIPTHTLNYLPLHALAKKQDGGLRFLVEGKRIAYLSSATLMDFAQAPNEDKNLEGLIALGDPAGANLPAAREEVQSIAQTIPASKVLIGENVTKEAIRQSGALDQRIVHFATHGVLNAAAPRLSYLQLAKPTPDVAPENFQLTVDEINGLPLQNVDLVTLSACETAVAENTVNAGQDLITLAGAFSYAGAPTVIATLWSVADESTKAWMVEFYAQLAGGKSKGDAFRAAQLKLLQSKEYSHPYYWAPFILMGDWR